MSSNANNSKRSAEVSKFARSAKKAKVDLLARQQKQASAANLAFCTEQLAFDEPVVLSDRPSAAELEQKERAAIIEAQKQNAIEQEKNLPNRNCNYVAHLKRRVYKEHFLRPPYQQPIDSRNGSDLEFMITHMDTCNSKSSIWDVDEKYNGGVEKRNYWSFFVRLFGVDAIGHSVCCYVAGWKPFVYVQLPPSWTLFDVEEWLKSVDTMHIPNLKRSVANTTLCVRSNMYGFTKKTGILVAKIEFASKKARQSLIDLLQVEVPNPDAPVRERQFLRRYFYDRAKDFVFWLWDACVSPQQQFINCTEIRPSNWVSVKQYTFHNEEQQRAPRERRTRCQIDINADLHSVKPLNDRKDIAPLLISSWDTEVARGALDRMFPQSSVPEDEMFQIGTSVMRFGDSYDAIPLYTCVHCLRPTDNPVPGVMHVNEFETERELLRNYGVFARDKVDADVSINFNAEGFDNDYWERRAEMHLGSARLDKSCPYKFADFDQEGLFEYGRVRGELSRVKTEYGGSSAHSHRETSTIKMAGRVQLDMFKYACQEWKMPRSLNFIAAEIFKQAAKSNKSLRAEDFVKLDMPFYELQQMYVQTSADRGKIAHYCAVDTHVPMRIAVVKQVLLAAIEFSRLSGLTIDAIINKKQMARGFAKLSKYVHDHNYMFPEWPERFVLDWDLREMMFGANSYEGACVFPPIRGFYSVPISTLDFAGLYPSIMRGFRLCYTTLILDPQFLNDPSVQYVTQTITDKDDPSRPPYVLHWCTNSEPLLYMLLTDLGNARTAAKKLMKQHSGDPFMYDLYNARQLNLKLMANSLYGYTGAKMNKYAMLAIAAAVTDHGREMIVQTKNFVETNEPTARVIYGDTDSVMIKFPEGTSLQYAFSRGKELAAQVTKLFPSEVSLEFEKVYMPSVFYIKKNYAGLKWTDLNEDPQYNVKGLAPVRGDKIPFVKNLCDDVLKTLLYKNDAAAAIEKIKAALEDMLSGRVAASEFVQEKKLTKMIDLYPENTVHAKVARAMARRDPAAAPQAGEIISYFVVESGRKGVVAVDCAHFYESKKYKLNMLYYLENLVRDTVGKLIDLPGLCSDVDALFQPYLQRARANAFGATSLAEFAVQMK